MPDLVALAISKGLLSPHTRGRLSQEEILSRVEGFIPAYAGKTYQFGLSAILTLFHPRIRGEDLRVTRYAWHGCSFIPAYAGKTRSLIMFKIKGLKVLGNLTDFYFTLRLDVFLINFILSNSIEKFSFWPTDKKSMPVSVAAFHAITAEPSAMPPVIISHNFSLIFFEIVPAKVPLSISTRNNDIFPLMLGGALCNIIIVIVKNVQDS